jgi:hypothetical protein
MPENPVITEIENLQQLIGSPEWIEALKVVKAHKEHLQKQVNMYVRAQDWMNAFSTLALYDDADRMFVMLKTRLDTLRKEKEE